MLSLPLVTLLLAPVPQTGIASSAVLLGDSQPPVVGSFAVEQHGNGRATVRWNTDEPTTGLVLHGTGTPLAGAAASPVTGQAHRVRLTGLAPGSSHLISVVATDLSGNRTVVPAHAVRVAGAVTGKGFEVSGELRPWHPITLRFLGPRASETDAAPNPFLDYRLEVELRSPGGLTVSVPGFFDGDGRGGGGGDRWAVRFPTHEPGTWSFTARFRQGPGVAVELDPGAGTPAWFDGTSGTFEVGPAGPAEPGLYARGKLFAAVGHYARFLDGTPFLKGGTNSPENLLAYAGFDNTRDEGGLSTSGLAQGLHRYEPHVADFGPPALGGLGGWDDPLFASEERGVDSRGLVGALDYLGSVGVNSAYFLPMNLGGDGWEVCPFVGYSGSAHDDTHYDLSKLWQWNEVLVHAARRGIAVQLVLGESEQPNELWLDDGELGPERKLFYREMVARFGHLPAIKWNLSEECEFPIDTVLEFAGHLRALDPYGHPIAFHVNLLPTSGESAQYDAVLGDPRIDATSLQAIPYTASDLVEKWRADSAAAGRPWIVDFDEQLTALTDANTDELRKLMLYDTLLSGGHVEWYMGYQPLPLGGDLRVEDFRTREAMWHQTAHARRLLEDHVPFWTMEPMDELVRGESTAWGGAEVLARPGRHYVVYLPEGTETGELDLRDARRPLEARWYDPRTGAFVGPRTTLAPGGWAPLPKAPSPTGEDWVLLVQG